MLRKPMINFVLSKIEAAQRGPAGAGRIVNEVISRVKSQPIGTPAAMPRRRMPRLPPGYKS